MADPQLDGSGRHLHRSGSAARAPIVAVLVAALVLGGLIDRAPGPKRPVSVPSVQAVPEAAASQALSSSWFCAGATDPHLKAGPRRGVAAGAVVIANVGSVTATGVITLVPSLGRHIQIPVSVARDSRTVVNEDVPGGAAWIGAIVDIDAGRVAVEQQVNNSLGQASTPCATAGSSCWFFATGATLINARVEISLLNPYSTDAVVGMSFTTNEGLEQPQQFQGLVIPPGGLVTVNLGDHLRRRLAIATSINAQSGRIVAWKTDVVTPPAPGAALLGTSAGSSPLADPATPIPGLTLTLGQPAPATMWTWADGNSGNGLHEQYVIYNPGPETARLTLSVDLDQGQAEPFTLSVGPFEVNTVVSSEEVRIPPGVSHAAVLQSSNGVPVVAERIEAASSPSPWSGLGELPGAPSAAAAAHWLLAETRADTSHHGFVVMYNPGSQVVQAVLEGLNGRAAVPLRSITVDPGRQAVLQLNTLAPSVEEALIVDASAPLYVESNYYGNGRAHGISLSLGVPLTG